MAQLPFWSNFIDQGEVVYFLGNSTVSKPIFMGLNLYDRISLNTVNIPLILDNASGSSISITLSLGLYTLSGATLTLVNSGAGAMTDSGAFTYYHYAYLPITSFSATSNLSPGTWFWLMLVSSSGTKNTWFPGIDANDFKQSNAFPGVFINGAMTATTSALPASIATSVLSVAGTADAMFTTGIIISA